VQFFFYSVETKELPFTIFSFHVDVLPRSKSSRRLGELATRYYESMERPTHKLRAARNAAPRLDNTNIINKKLARSTK